jgi:hypothetical protein
MLLVVMAAVCGMAIDWLEGVAPAAKAMDLGLMTGFSKDIWVGHMVQLCCFTIFFSR